MTNLELGTEIRLLKDLPDLEASDASVGVVEADEHNRKYIHIGSNDVTRDGWYFYLDEVKDFDKWFEVIQ